MTFLIIAPYKYSYSFTDKFLIVDKYLWQFYGKTRHYIRLLRTNHVVRTKIVAARCQAEASLMPSCGVCPSVCPPVDIPTGTPLTGASNAGGVGKICDSSPISARLHRVL